MRLSIIIPTIGRDTINSVVDSLLSQLNKDTVIYIVFDGKSNSKKYLSIKKQYQNASITFLATEKPYSGAANARNIALQKAVYSSDIVSFLGDDTTPDPDWIQKTIQWHQKNPSINQATLGRVFWTSDLQKDPFHKWLDGNIQFDFKNLEKGCKPDWRHFTTSNFSLKAQAFQKPNGDLFYFNNTFQGWGFEDGELGYQMQKGLSLEIHFSPSIKVTHDHPQTFAKVLLNLQNARKNAQLFQSIHPEVNLLPTGFKKILLSCLAFITFLVPKAISLKLYWWSRTKLVWLGYRFPIQKD